MKINKNSWHYKLVDLHSDIFSMRMPDSLCPYMRRLLIWSPIAAILALAIITVVSMVMVIGPVVAWSALIFEGIAFDFEQLMGTFGTMGTIAWAVVLLFVSSALLADWWKFGLNRSIKAATPKERFSRSLDTALTKVDENVCQSSLMSMIIKYWDAVHNKFCPTLEYSNGSK